jgi:hypothetical protein
MSSILHLVELLSLLRSAIISHHEQILGSFFAFMSQSRLALGGGQRRNVALAKISKRLAKR